jgi:hypothetical protein
MNNSLYDSNSVEYFKPVNGFLKILVQETDYDYWFNGKTPEHNPAHALSLLIGTILEETDDYKINDVVWFITNDIYELVLSINNNSINRIFIVKKENVVGVRVS